jgi:hypothetical protein
MVSVYQVYQSLKALLNKEQSGFITPQVFNNFAQMAQMNIYNEMFTELTLAKKLLRQGFDSGRDKSPRKLVLEDLSMYLRSTAVENIGFNAASGADTSSVSFLKPLDLSRIVSVEIGDGIAPSFESRVACELIYDADDVSRIVGSNLSSPTDDFPVALVAGDRIEVIPNGNQSVILTYYAKPTSFNSSGVADENPPMYAFRTYNQESFFDGLNSRDFMLPSHYLNEIVMEMAKLIGLRLKDADVVAFSTKEETSE